jgi:AmmeMemoRadiSam system protein B
MKIRKSAVAGMFYPRDPNHLEQLLEKFFRGKESEMSARGIVSPHAGYIYSGEVAANAFGAVPSSFTGTFIVIGPSHRGYQTCVSLIPWETPLGIIDPDPEFINALDLEVDEVSHQDEHSLEVQMPFIKYRFPRSRIVPIMMGSQDPQSAARLAEDVLRVIRETGRDVTIVASSDFSHYVPADIAKANDLYVIEALKTLDISAFYHRIRERNVSACGYGPIAAMCHITRGVGAQRAELLRYATSGDVTGDREVVGYAAVAVI